MHRMPWPAEVAAASMERQRSRSNSEGSRHRLYGSDLERSAVVELYFTSDDMRGGAESTTFAQTLVATYQPLNTLTLAPTFSYRMETQRWSGAKIQTPTASVSLLYKQSQRLLVSAAGGYTSTKSTDGLIGTESIVGGNVCVQPELIYGHPTTLSLEASYSNTTNRTVVGVDTEDLSGLVRILVAAL
ncbi:MAG: hypothetical protein MRJ92_09815 [Nitrospira sp.]|nr:hypothetical protein [Nitrospira sp.]